jgi:hypothetical protein
VRSGLDLTPVSLGRRPPEQDEWFLGLQSFDGKDDIVDRVRRKVVHIGPDEFRALIGARR